MENKKSTGLRKIRMTKIQKIILISIIIYSLTLVFHALYVSYIDPSYQVIIADQVVFYNRGKGVLYGLLPYRDFYTKAAPLSSYLWAPLILISMIFTNDYSPDLLTSANYTDSASMMFSSYVFRTFFVICLIAAAVVLYKLLELKKNKHSFWISLTFAINPFFLYLVSFWGSDESILPLLILLPIYLFEKKKSYLATIIIILGAGLKYVPIFLAPLIWIYSENWKQRIIQSVILLLGIVAVYLPFYFVDPAGFLAQFDNKIAHDGNQGILSVLQTSSAINFDEYSYVFVIVTFLLLAGFSLYFFFKKENWNYQLVNVLFMVFLLFYPKIQFSFVVLMYPFLFISIFKKRFERWISLTVLITSMISGEMANLLIKGTTENIFLISFAWIIVLLFYLSMITLLLKILLDSMLKKELKIEKM
ncbi:MAG: DUF2029 domain-containing protein [Candidatus Heimdallarchaeota archaeon]|nr:DUF2029 domain-containing protein [Candidatus Heimdallarchaeota archaeon]